MSAIIADINALSSDSVIAVLLEINIPATGYVRLCSNNENLVFAGETYLPFPFQLSELTTAAKGEVPQWQIQIDNSSRIIESYLQDYDTYLKANGISGNEISCTCYVVSTVDLSSAIMTEYFTLTSWSTSSKWAAFKLGASSPFTLRFPRRRILQNFCGWKFKGSECGYSGFGTSCEKTLSACRAFTNSARFGGFPGIGKGLRI